ncbi:hypothetical protein Sta7437_0357 [Stanieria cyanosphaera PCC 7437]|uniref:SPOR domain-containing protein n=1 Tax=Stanieria cyanosphaera (strain ATCC 29371 / PCC 7437) TaxID=111780 RepID=K9XN61_STAC7|nr:SPOR domain-containing protein [Stanieria cyanosphaera]AFZ33968.1 hypothetical protein Sta7437_0357 [Stanieria cyanosphaera PCC 7437]
MTTKLLFLNQFLNSELSLLLKLIRAFSLSGYFLLTLIPTTLVEVNSAIAETLPPPPLVQSPRSSIWENQDTQSKPIISNRNQNKREYTFSAPVSSSSEKAQGYRVEVFGDSDILLSQVRDIEPKAFRKGDIIQVGIFSDQKNAEDMVRKLALQGLWARIKIQ